MRKAKDDSHRRFKTEVDARKFLLDALQNDFMFYEEIWARDTATGQRYRMDAVSVCEHTGHILGWEFKKSHLFKSEFCAALKQAIDYRGAVIDDDRLPGLVGNLVEACIVFPDWDGLHDDGEMVWGKEADGMRLLASHFRVGTLIHRQPSNIFHIVIGEQAIWHSNSGWTGNANGVLLGKRRRGATKSYDAVTN
jgi:hypothetical protein